jgi:hypothetical protein
MDIITRIVRALDIDSMPDLGVLVFGVLVGLFAGGIFLFIGLAVAAIFRSWRRWRANRNPLR